MAEDADLGVEDAELNWCQGAVVTLTHQNTRPKGLAAVAGVWTHSTSRLVLGSISKTSCSPPPILVCRPGKISDTPGVVVTLWFLQPPPQEFSIEICIAQPDAKGYDTVQPCDLDQ